MINSKGEWIYTNAEIAYELGISSATVNAIGKRLYGCTTRHWTIKDVEMIVGYLKSISVEEETKRLALLHKTIAECGFEKMADSDVKSRFDKDLYHVD